MPRFFCTTLLLALTLSAPAWAQGPPTLTLEDTPIYVLPLPESSRWGLHTAPGDAPLAELEVPLGLSPDMGTFSLQHAPLSRKLTALILTFTPHAPGTPHRFVLTTPNTRLSSLQLLWSGPDDPRLNTHFVTLDTSTSPASLLRTSHDPAYPDCGQLTTAPAPQRFDPSTQSFKDPIPHTLPTPTLNLTPTAPTQPIDTLLQHTLASRLLRASAATSHAQRQSASGVDALPTELTDHNTDTLWTPHPSDSQRIVLLQLPAALHPQSLLLIPAPNTLLNGTLLHNTTSTAVLEEHTGGPALIPWETRSGCLALRLPQGASLAEVSLLSHEDTGSLEDSLTPLIAQLFESDSRAERQALAQLITAYPEYLDAPLTAYLAQDPVNIPRILELTPHLSPTLRLNILAAVALHPNTPPEDLERIQALFAQSPARAAAAIGERAKGLTPDSETYRRAAILLAPLPVDGHLKPLLKAIDRAYGADQLNAIPPLFDALVAVGPDLVPPLTGFVSAPWESMRDATRILLMRALLRVAPAWRLQADALPIEAPADLLVLLKAQRVSHRILGIRLLAAFQIFESYPVLDVLSHTASIDTERAQALRAVASFGLEPTSQALLDGLSDPQPTVRIAATESLAQAAFASREEVQMALLERIEEDTWPEARSAALLGLARGHHPQTASLAQAWLDAKSPLLQQAAVDALLILPQPIPWPLAQRVFESERLNAGLARQLLGVFVERAPTDDLAQLDAWLRVTPTDEDAIERYQRLLDLSMHALHVRNYNELVDLLLWTVENHPDTELAVTALHLAGYYDTPDVRATLEAATQSAHERSANTAAESLNRLDGTLREPLDLPE